LILANIKYFGEGKFLMSITESNENRDKIYSLKKHKVSIILIIIICIESSVVGMTLSNQIQTQKSLDKKTQEYNSLIENFGNSSEINIGNLLATYYEYLRNNISTSRSVDFAANLGMHDLAMISWSGTEEDNYYDAVGEYSCDTASDNIDKIIDLIGLPIDLSYVEKIRKILIFIDQYITYEADVDEVFHAPVETLTFKSGDCDDFAILAAALFEYVDIDAAIAFFSNDDGKYHAATLVHLDSLGSYGSWYYSNLTGRGLEAGKWIIIEPQITIGRQYDDWDPNWDLDEVAPLDL
jgi:hypothetical protein